jgi:hypothetical protein
VSWWARRSASLVLVLLMEGRAGGLAEHPAQPADRRAGQTARGTRRARGPEALCGATEDPFLHVGYQAVVHVGPSSWVIDLHVCTVRV